MARLLLAVLLTAFLGWPRLGFASIVPPLDLTDLCERADLIVIGRVTDRRLEARTTIQIGSATVEGTSNLAQVGVERVLKGEKLSNVTFGFVLPARGLGYSGAPLGRFGVFFLRKAPERYEVLDPYHSYVVAAPGAAVREGSCLDQLTQAVAHVFSSADKPVQDRWSRWHAVRALETVKTPLATAALRTAAQDNDPLPRIWALGALLRRNDIAMLDTLEQAAASSTVPGVENLTAHLGSAIERIRDKQAIPQLARLVQAADVNLRRGAAGALRGIGGRASIEPLVRALEDPDDSVVLQAVYGLAEINGNLDWGPSENFAREREKYVQYWRNWAKARPK